MAEKSIIISAEEEAILLKPIDNMLEKYRSRSMHCVWKDLTKSTV